jgi:molybdopterin-binding protein
VQPHRLELQSARENAVRLDVDTRFTLVSEIDVETPAGLLVTSVITTRSVRDLQLVVGKEVIALVKSTEVSIAAL